MSTKFKCHKLPNNIKTYIVYAFYTDFLSFCIPRGQKTYLSDLMEITDSKERRNSELKYRMTYFWFLYPSCHFDL